ncbi:efflux RND transporter periplasmic adaptor subunit [Saccharicrinis aurantiacus]|uniref:efflux RND transporter periplasmic adaptor subunit n=1 Tax=Saccharicrinis aurantiacus TaxID=1849719 RepID=UPI0015C54D01|nr:efflux RND transporter periplasmic adaptor subunit [Saccharicrinis aurantiacus]
MKTRNILIGFIAISLAACSGSETKEKISELAELKADFTELKKQITKLEKEIEEESGSKEGAVNVATKVITPETYNHYIEVTGKVKADENTIISPEGAGKITEILVEEGDNVRKGQTLAYLNNDALDTQIEQAKVNLNLAITTFERQERLWNQNIGSEMEYLQAKSNKESLEQNLRSLNAQKDMMSVKSQINGVVDEVFQRKGEIAGPSLPFARVVNIDKVYVNTEVGEKFLGTINKGDATEIYFPSIKKTVDAKIYRSSTVINDISRTFRVRINLDNKSHEIKPNLLTSVKLRVFSADDLIIVPSILVKQDFEGEFIFVATESNGKSIAKKQYVTSIFNSDNKTIISEGLKSGDQIITVGYDQIVNGTEIAIVKS